MNLHSTQILVSDFNLLWHLSALDISLMTDSYDKREKAAIRLTQTP